MVLDLIQCGKNTHVLVNHNFYNLLSFDIIGFRGNLVRFMHFKIFEMRSLDGRLHKGPWH